MKKILLILLTLPFICFGQSVYKNDTIHFTGYIGIICDSLYFPESSRKIFPQNRFKPSIIDIKNFETNFIKQYAAAIEKHHKLFYETYKANYRDSFSDNEWKSIEKYRKSGKKNGRISQEKLIRDFDKYDRFYYGYIGNNGQRYIRIEFKPHEEKYVEIAGTGESQLDNYPLLAFNLNTQTLSLAGWTGENDEIRK